MFKKFFSLLMIFLLMPFVSAGQDAATECGAIVPNGWTPSLEQAQTLIEDELTAGTRNNQHFLTQTSQSMAGLRDARLFIAYVQLMNVLDTKEQRDLFNQQKIWLSKREQSGLSHVIVLDSWLQVCQTTLVTYNPRRIAHAVRSEAANHRTFLFTHRPSNLA